MYTLYHFHTRHIILTFSTICLYNGLISLWRTLDSSFSIPRQINQNTIGLAAMLLEEMRGKNESEGQVCDCEEARWSPIYLLRERYAVGTTCM